VVGRGVGIGLRPEEGVLALSSLTVSLAQGGDWLLVIGCCVARHRLIVKALWCQYVVIVDL